MSEAKELFQSIDGESKRKKSFTIVAFKEDFLERGSLAFQRRTLEIYERAFNHLIRICGNKILRNVTPYDAERFKLGRAKSVSPVSVNIEFRALKAAFGDARRNRFIDENPFESVKPLRVPYKEQASLSKSQVQELLESIEDPEFQNLITFAINTVMRSSEICGLMWDDVDLEKGEIHVRSCLKRGKPRTLPMNPWVHAYLASKPGGTGFVVTNTKGGKYTKDAIGARFRRSRRKAGLDRSVHFHTLRHTGISMMLNSGVPAASVQKLAGHSSLTVTQAYMHVPDRNLQDAVMKFNWQNMN